MEREREFEKDDLARELSFDAPTGSTLRALESNVKAEHVARSRGGDSRARGR